MLCSGKQVYLLLLGLQFVVCWRETLALPLEPAVKRRQQSTETTSTAAFGTGQPAINHQLSGDKASQTTFLSVTQHSRRFNFKTNKSSSESELKISQLHHNARATIIKQDRGLEPHRNARAGDINTGISPPVSLQDSSNTAKTAVAVIIVVGIVVLVGLMHFKVCAEIKERFSCCRAKHDTLSQSTPDDEPRFVAEAAARADDVKNLTPLSWMESGKIWMLRVIHKLLNSTSGRTVTVPSWELVRVPLRESGGEMHS